MHQPTKQLLRFIFTTKAWLFSLKMKVRLTLTILHTVPRVCFDHRFLFSFLHWSHLSLHLEKKTLG